MQRSLTKSRPAGLLVCALALALSLSTARPRAQGLQSPARERVLLGLRLRPEVAAWLEEVERKMGREVYAEFAQLGPDGGDEGFVGGENYVTERGAAVVRINFDFQSAENRGRLEATLAHEILHLRQRARGFPAFTLDEASSSPRVPLAELNEMEVAGALMEAVEHHAILPDLHRLGLDTVADMIGGLAWTRGKGVSTDHPLYAVYYLRALLEYDDPARLRELEQIYRRNRWTRSLQRGAAMAQLVRAAPLRTPAEMTGAFLRCLNELFGGLYRFTARPAPTQFPRDRIFPTVPIAVAFARR
jgi:hypothetical protein